VLNLAALYGLRNSVTLSSMSSSSAAAAAAPASPFTSALTWGVIHQRLSDFQVDYKINCNKFGKSDSASDSQSTADSRFRRKNGIGFPKLSIGEKNSNI
jgi:hypothetical protein